jgi:hypothetical protein
MQPEVPTPLGVWDVNDGEDSAYWAHWREISRWAVAHFPNRASDVYRAEFYLIDTPFAVLFRYAEDDHGRHYTDPATGEVARTEPVTMTLSELPPGHLLQGRAINGEDPSVPVSATGTGSTTDTADDDTDIPAGLLVSVGERGGYAVPRQLDGHTRR